MVSSLIKGNVSPALIKYVRTLDRSSKNFEKEKKNFLKRHGTGNKNQETFQTEIESLMKNFFIPVTKENQTFVFAYLIGCGDEKYRMICCEIASEKRPVEIVTTEPSVVIVVHDHMSKKEWDNAYSSINKKIQSFDNLKNEAFVYKGSPNIDLDLELYRLNKIEGKKAKEIFDDKLSLAKKFPNCATYEYVRFNTSIKEISKIIESL
ncbi:hypothetical protein HOG48_06255 [Candidatus Peregrinibacteria bacterium]|jgi:hypothetical protein|nr:hypothetical protein [Candidatus Peregrinibacteria bacterium]